MNGKLKFPILLFLMATISLPAFQFPDQERQQIAAQMEYSIQHELLNKWYPQAVDQEYGGFLSTFSYDFKPTGPQDKMIVTQARHVWSNAKAFEFYRKETAYRNNAKHGFYFLRDIMWDKEYGGFYTLVDRKGKVLDTDMGIKTAYGNAFAIYALATYYQCSGDDSALNLAKEAFGWMEKHSHDPINIGYFQHLQRDGSPVKRTPDLPSTAETGYKDQNSSIHLLEAFTELYQVWPDELVRKRLEEMLFLIRDRITTQQGWLRLFFQPDWTPVSIRDSSMNYILQHHNLDYVSFGHNVETAYLMLEASETLGLKNDTKTIQVAKKMVDHALMNGWDNKTGGFYDEGFYFKDSTSMSILRDTKNWWAQAEGLNSLLLMSDYFPEDAMQYFQKFKLQWKYAQTYLIDHQYGEWYPGGLDKEPQLKTAQKGQIWKGNYHVFRALSNCVERLLPDKIPPSAPTNLKIDRNNNVPMMIWNSSTDNRTIIGYNIYNNEHRLGFTPLNKFSLKEFHLQKGEEISVSAIDRHGNESPSAKMIY
jgi:mannobiose 2-epimerase